MRTERREKRENKKIRENREKNSNMVERNFQGSAVRTQGGYMAYELTREGWLFCAFCGLMEEMASFILCRIEVLYVPLPVFLVLWAAFGIVTSALLCGIGHLQHVQEQKCADVIAFCEEAQTASWLEKKAS